MQTNGLLPIENEDRINGLAEEFLNADRLLADQIEEILSNYPDLNETLEYIGSESTRAAFAYTNSNSLRAHL